MDQSKDSKGNKKVGADGLTKKERRALKVNAVSKNVIENKDQAKTEAQKNPAAIKDKATSVSNEVKSQTTIKKSNDSQVSVKSPDVSTTVNQTNNKELKAQRRAIQEAQRLAKANAKNIEQAPGGKEKQNDVKEKKVEESNEPSKAELRAQRRAIQEAQRLAKANLKVEQPVKQQKEKNDQGKSTNKTITSKKDVSKSDKAKHKVQLFNHLYFENAKVASLKSKNINVDGVHAAFIKIGAQYSSKTILGSNARCLAMLSALKSLISDFVTPSKQEFCRSLESTLNVCITHLSSCRPLAVSMTNALKHFKIHLTQMDTNLSDDAKRALLLENVETYITDQIDKAGEAISIQVLGKIFDNDVILTYGCSSLITKILLDAHKQGKKFKVIIVDGRPLLEGREMLRKLVCAGIQCSYILINAASFVMSKVTKVLLGAHALLANGYVMSRTGTAQVSLIANAYKKPVLVCCETYKFCERVQMDSFVYNEIGDPNKLITIDTLEENSPLTNWENSNYLAPLNLMYDVTPPDLVTAVVTELAFLPCTSVPVVLRIKPTV
ncbi:hypothetical protein ILUMI_27139 [Ignelater luminosus]|uniref:Translation initiation factor eIF2B subunit delta n=1 Tax=Ignelater luminosus TaxID=2038154 RepID=A0A8K0FVR5_IGNLU|nr:hypothetical protein ILUMI_27139 [Ignelater luminosus]